jgi:peptidoglycan/LPS O-acetylase OafA/YrhL
MREALGQTWSLCTESVFYVLLPPLAILALGRTWRPRRTLAFLSAFGVLGTGGWITGMSLGWLDMRIHPMWFPSYAIWFAGGMALATVQVALESGTAPASWRVVADLGRSPLTCWTLGAGIFVVASTPLTGPRGLFDLSPGQFGFRLVLFVAVALLVVLPAAFPTGGLVSAALGSRFAGWLGAVSYGLFLWHPFVLTVLNPAMSGPSLSRMVIWFTLIMAGGLALASLSWYGLERPLQRWDQRRRSRPATVRAGGFRRRRTAAEAAPVPVEAAPVLPEVPAGIALTQSTANAASPAS